MKETDEVIHELTQEEIDQDKPFAHFGWEGDGAFSFQTISDGYWESAKILLETMMRKHYNFAVVDSLVYPMFFNYRHSIETFLKSLFFNLGEQTEQARREYLEIGHDLQQLWARLRPYLNKGKKHVGTSVNLNAIEHYLISINDFDSDSMIMRYPVGKNLDKNKTQAHHFDFIHFGERMDELCNSLRQLDYELSNQMSEEASIEELNEYLAMREKYRLQIDEFLSLLKEEIKNESSKSYHHEDIIKMLKAGPSKKLKFLVDCEPDLLILLDNLYYGGSSVNLHSVRLSNSPVTRQKEFVKLCYELLKKDGLCFGKEPQNSDINIWGKQSSVLLSEITAAVDILDLKQ